MQLNFTTLGKLLERNLRTDQQRPDQSSLDLDLITKHARVTQFFLGEEKMLLRFNLHTGCPGITAVSTIHCSYLKTRASD